MTQNNNFSVLPWYTSLEQQNARKWWVYGRKYPLYTPAGYILPFQLIVPHTTTPSITSVALYEGNTGQLIGEYGADFSTNGLTIKQFEDYDVVVFPGSGAIFGSMENGRYYLSMVVNGDTYYSEIFTVVNDIEPYLEIEWWNVEDLVMDAGIIVYTEPTFRNKIFLPADIAKPDYLFEEEGETRDGYFFPTKQISEKRYRFNFFAPEYLLDVMRFIRMSDYVKIYKNGQTYNADTFLITPEWEAEGDVAVVSAEFDTNTVAKKIPYIAQGIIPPTPGEHYLTVSPTSATFLPAGQTIAINIVSDVSWAVSLPSWLSSDTMTGTENATIQVTAQANTGESSKTGNIVISGGGITRNISVIQPASDAAYLSVSPTSINFNAEGQTVSVSVNASAGLAWTLSVPSWVTASQLSGSGSANITLTAPANTTGSARSEAYAVFSASGVSNANITLNQAAQIIPSLSVSPNDRVYNSNPHTFYYTVTCNGRWECVSSSAPSWLTCASSGEGNGIATIVLTQNTGVQRQGTLTFRMTDYPSVTYEVRITQEEYEPTITYELELGVASKTLGAGGESYTLAVQGITKTDGVETSRVNLSASDLTITQTGSNAISREGLTFSAQDLGTTVTSAETANFALVWNDHTTATATFVCKQQANTRTVYSSTTTWADHLPDPIIWNTSGTSIADSEGDSVVLSPDVDEITTVTFRYTSGHTNTETATIRHEGTWGISGVGFAINNNVLSVTANSEHTQRTGRLTLTYERGLPDSPDPYIVTRDLTQEQDLTFPIGMVLRIVTNDYTYENPALRPGDVLRWERGASEPSPYQYVYTTLYPSVGDKAYTSSAMSTEAGTIMSVTYP